MRDPIANTLLSDEAVDSPAITVAREQLELQFSQKLSIIRNIIDYMGGRNGNRFAYLSYPDHSRFGLNPASKVY